MDYIGVLLCAVNVYIFHAETLCEEHIYLDSYECIFLAEHVFILNVKLWSIECGFIYTDSIFYAEVVKDSFHCCLSCFPLLGCAFVLILRVCGIPLREAEGAVLEKSDSAEEVFCEFKAVSEFVLELLGAEDIMSLGDGELTNSDKSVHLAAVLVSEQGRCFRQAHRQVTVAALSVQEHLILERAGHGSEGEAFLCFVCGVAEDEHSVEIVIPVA